MTITNRAKIIWGILIILLISTCIFWWLIKPSSISSVPKIGVTNIPDKINLIQNKEDKKNSLLINQDQIKQDQINQDQINQDQINQDQINQDQIAPTQKYQSSGSELSVTLTNVTAGSFGTLNKLRSKIDELKLQVQIEELEVKRKELQSKTVSGLPKELPIISLPTISIVKTAAKQSPAFAVIEVSGINNNLTATIRMRSKKLIQVQKGQSFNGGIIKEISRNSVVVQYGSQKTVMLPFE